MCLTAKMCVFLFPLATFSFPSSHTLKVNGKFNDARKMSELCSKQQEVFAQKLRTQLDSDNERSKNEI